MNSNVLLKCKAANWSRAIQAFTLVEILVVILIISVLITLLFPAVNSARDSANSSVCLSNLRKLAVANQLYSDDNNNRLIPCAISDPNVPYPITWRALLVPYLEPGDESVKNPFVCPSDAVARKSPGTDGSGLNPASYGLVFDAMNWPNLLHFPDYSGKDFKTSVIKHPARLILFTDMGHPDNPNLDPSKWTETIRNPYDASYGYARFPGTGDANFLGGDCWNAYPRHGKQTKLNVAFYDGHAESVDWKTRISEQPWGAEGCLIDNH